MSRKNRIQAILLAELNAEILIIEDESHQHRVAKEAESHFKIIAVSPCFASLKTIERHRYVNRLIGAEFSSGLHALSLSLYTPEEWQLRSHTAPMSPPCQHSK